MCIRFSISTKVKAISFFIALTLVVISSLTEFFSSQNALIIFGFNISAYRVLIISISSLFIGVLLTLTFSFVTPRIDKKLEILNKEYFMPLLTFFYNNERSHSESFITYLDEAKRNKENLVKYGKYFKIPCYPRKLVKDIDEFFKRAEEHNSLLLMIKEILEKKIGKDNLRILFGLLKLSDINLEVCNPDTVKLYEPASNYIKQEKMELIEKIVNSNKEVRKMQKDIISRFENFLKDNSLEISKSKTDEICLVL